MFLSKDGSSFFHHNFNYSCVNIPNGTYYVRNDINAGLFLSKQPDLKLPPDLFVLNNYPERVIRTYKHFNKSLGVIFQGISGSGKTIDAKKTAILSNLPIVMIDTVYNIECLMNFLKSFDNDVVIIIDEFEKIFSPEDQIPFLNFLDGLNFYNHLFLVTMNSPHINEYFLNRPGRFRYLFQYEYLNDNEIDLILEKYLSTEFNLHKYKENLLENISNLTSDSLMKIIEESNLYHQYFSEFHAFFNYKVSSDLTYDIKGTVTLHIPEDIKDFSYIQLEEDQKSPYFCSSIQSMIRTWFINNDAKNFYSFNVKGYKTINKVKLFTEMLNNSIEVSLDFTELTQNTIDNSCILLKTIFQSNEISNYTFRLPFLSQKFLKKEMKADGTIVYYMQNGTFTFTPVKPEADKVKILVV